MKKTQTLALVFFLFLIKGYTQTSPATLPLSDCLEGKRSTAVSVQGEPETYIERFVLVNPVTDTDLRELRNGDTIYTGTPYNIRVEAIRAGSVRIKWGTTFNRLENDAPFSLAGDNNGDYASWSPVPGLYTLSATPYTQRFGQGIQGSTNSLQIRVINPPPVRFVLVNADTDSDIMELRHGMTIDLNLLPTDHLNIRADITWPQTESVRFGFQNKSSFRVESVAPYALYGDNNGNYNSWTPSEGQYTLTATAFSKDGASGTQGPSATITFSFTRNTSNTVSYIELNNLVVLYNNTNIGPLGADIRERMEMILSNTTLFYWRHSYMKLKINWTIIEVDEYRNIIHENGLIYPHEVDADLQNMGYLPSSSPQPGTFDAVYAVANGSGNYAWGAHAILGRAGFLQTAFWSDIYNYWVAVHEFHHIIDDMFYRSGFPLYPHNHPGAARVQGEFVPNSGPDWDLNWKIVQYWNEEDWLALANQGVWGRIQRTVDSDGDGIPDNDPSVPLDEARFGSDPDQTDTDNDDLTDLEEAMAGIFSGTDPLDPDTDNDGLDDGDDSEKLYPFNTTVPFNASLSISNPVSSWPLAGSYYFDHPTDPASSLRLAYSSGSLYIALTVPTFSSSPIHVFIDGNNDGIFHGSDNLEIILNGNSIQEVLLFDAAAVPPGDYSDFFISVIPLTGFSGITETAAGFTTYKLAIPRLAQYGLNLVSGEQIGLRVTVDNYGSMLELDDYITLTLGNSSSSRQAIAGTEEIAPFVLFPNPAEDRITVSWKTSFIPKSIRVMNAMGKIIINQSPESQVTSTLHTADLPPGCYSVQLISEGEIRTVGFVKK